MAFYRTCARCGANLDPGEPCDCEQEEIRMRERFVQKTKMNSKTGQISFVFDRKDVGCVAKGNH